MADFVAWRVFAMFGEFDAKAAVRAFVKAG